MDLETYIRRRPRLQLALRVVVAPVLLVAAVIVVVTVGRSHHHPSCAGRCGPPYRLDVTFRDGTPPAFVRSEVARCTKDPEVTGVGRAVTFEGGGPTLSLTTRDFGRTAKTQGLLTCLAGLPAVQSVGYPD